MIKIRWNEQEMLEVGNRARHLISSNGNTSILDAVRKAQEILPKNRQRPLKGISQLERIVEICKLNDYSSEIKKEEIKEIIQLIEPVKTEEQSVVTFEHLIDKFAERFADKVANALANSLKSRLIGILSRSVTSITEDDKQQKRKVVVIGPKEDQATMLNREFGKLLDLRVFDASQLDLIGKNVANAAHVVLWTKFTTHAAQNLVPANKRIFINEGMDKIRAKLEELYCLD